MEGGKFGIGTLKLNLKIKNNNYNYKKIWSIKLIIMKNRRRI